MKVPQIFKNVRNTSAIALLVTAFVFFFKYLLEKATAELRAGLGNPEQIFNKTQRGARLVLDWIKNYFPTKNCESTVGA